MVIEGEGHPGNGRWGEEAAGGQLHLLHRVQGGHELVPGSLGGFAVTCHR